MLVYKPCTCHITLGPGLIIFLFTGEKPCQVTRLSSFDRTLRQVRPGHTILPQSTLQPLLLELTHIIHVALKLWFF